jgi:hypothetical protein
MIGMVGDEEMAGDRGVGCERQVGTLRHDDGAGGTHGFQQQGVARCPAALRRAGLIETMVKADGEGSGFVRAGQQACKDSPVPWPRAELGFACRIPRDDDKGWADRDWRTMGQPEVVGGPIYGSECGRGCGPQTERQDRREQSYGTGLEPGGVENLSPQA